jgi:hypothetical protein
MAAAINIKSPSGHPMKQTVNPANFSKSICLAWGLLHPSDDIDLIRIDWGTKSGGSADSLPAFT